MPAHATDVAESSSDHEFRAAASASIRQCRVNGCLSLRRTPEFLPCIANQVCHWRFSSYFLGQGDDQNGWIAIRVFSLNYDASLPKSLISHRKNYARPCKVS